MKRTRTHAAPIRHLARLTLLGLAAAMMLGSGCSWYRLNKCWVGVDKYNVAKATYLRLGSLDQTREELKLALWRPCEINQAIYWIEKDLYLDGSEDLE